MKRKFTTPRTQVLARTSGTNSPLFSRIPTKELFNGDVSLLNDWFVEIKKNNPDNADWLSMPAASMGEWYRAIRSNNPLAVYDGPDGYTINPLKAYRHGAVSPTT